jgi:RNA polymerase sigma factor (sigma-70 family)
VDVAAAGFLEQAFDEHRAALERSLSAQTRDVSVGQELAQEAFYRLAREIDRGRMPRNAGAWLHRVGSNLVISRGRHLQVIDRRLSILVRPSEPPSPETVVIGAERRAALHSTLAQLTGTERRALALAAEGLGGAEVAASIGRTPAATRTLLCRARRKLRRLHAELGLDTA